MSYYNKAALRGGWDFERAPTSGDAMPATGDLITYGSQIAAAFPPPVATAWSILVEKLLGEMKIASTEQALGYLGLLATLDALKIESRDPDTNDAARKLAQVKYRLLKVQFANDMNDLGYKRIRRFMHPPIKTTKEERAELRAPAFAPGPYIPYQTMRYFPSPPAKWKITRNHTKHVIPLDTGTWGSLPAAYTTLPRADRHMDPGLKAALQEARTNWYREQQGKMG